MVIYNLKKKNTFTKIIFLIKIIGVLKKQICLVICTNSESTR